MKLITIFIFISLILTSSIKAASFKKYAGEYQNIGIGNRSLAMGGAGTALANDVTSVYWNPAGLAEARGFQIEFMHTKQLISSIQQNYLGFSHEVEDNTTLGISLIYLTVTDIPDSRFAWDSDLNKVDFSKVRKFSTGDYTLYLTYGKKFNDKLSFGFNVKGIYRDYHIETALGMGFDAGLKYNLWNNLILGAMFRDVTTSLINWSTGEKELIKPSLRLGITYPFKIESIDLHLQPSVDINILAENRQYASQMNWGWMSIDSFLGMEIGYKNLIAVRAGRDDLNRFNTGIGFQIPRIRFDYSFTAFASELGDIHRISFHLDLNTIF